MQKWKVCLTFESEGNILLAFKIARYFGMAIEDIFIYEEGTE